MYNNVAPGDHTITVACSAGSVMVSDSVDVSVSGKGYSYSTYVCLLANI